MTTRPFELAQLEPVDASACADIHATGFDTPWSAEAFGALLEEETTAAWGVWLGSGRLAALAVYRCVLEEADLLTLVSRADERRRGLAQFVLVATAETLAARGIQRVTLDVAADNEPAIALYSALGFGEDGIRKAYYPRASGPPVDARLFSAPTRRIAGLSSGSTSSTDHDED